MKMKLVIKNIGKLKNIKLDLNKLIILTGDNWSGKSTLLKIIQLVKTIYRREHEIFEEFLEDARALGKVEDINKKIDLEINHVRGIDGIDYGIIGRILEKEIGIRLKDNSLIQFLINGRTVIKINYEKTILKNLGKEYLNDFKSFELPEANWFPTRQIEVVGNIGVDLNDRIDVVVTTHSVYILCTLNNLMYAGMLYANEKVDKGKLSSIISKRYTIEPGSVSAYYIEDGRLIDLIDYETGLIVNEKLDEASFLIEKEFDSLCNLDPRMYIQ